MPYKIDENDPRVVLVWKNGHWMVEKRHESSSDAQDHLVALKKNVEEAGGYE